MRALDRTELPFGSASRRACAALAFIVLAAACSPAIATGTYLCGAEEDCPEGQQCNGADNTCVIPTSAVAFACDPMTETREPDQDVAHADPLGTLACVSSPLVIAGCLANGDKDDWFTFSTRADCTSVAINLSIASALAFEPVTFELADATSGAKVASGAANCANVEAPDVSGEYTYCITQMLAPGTAYTLRVTPTGDATCGGNCAFNRYRLTATTSRN